MEYIEAKGHQTLIRLYIQPGAAKNELVGLYGGPPRLKVKIKALPKDNEANFEVIAFMAELLKIPKGQVELLRGQTSRQKDILVNKNLEEVNKIISIHL